MISLEEYERLASETDVIDRSTAAGRAVPLLGVLGEFGSVVDEVKKHRRDGDSYTGYENRLREELGDLLWYVATVARSANLRLAELEASPVQAIGDREWIEFAGILSELALEMHGGGENKERLRSLLAKSLSYMRAAAGMAGLRLEEVAEANVEKTRSRFAGERTAPAPYLDVDLPEEERLPRSRVVDFIERERPGKGASVIMRCNGISVGDRLTDNAHDDDGYRFHDAFHLAHAAVLGWSPVTRALFRAKRKSRPELDEVEDGARAIIAEESISFLVFDYARHHKNLEGVTRLDLDLVRQIRSLVSGLEAERRAIWEWERAILSGYAVFRKLCECPRGGRVRLDADRRLLEYQGPVPQDDGAA